MIIFYDFFYKNRSICVHLRKTLNVFYALVFSLSSSFLSHPTRAEGLQGTDTSPSAPSMLQKKDSGSVDPSSPVEIKLLALSKKLKRAIIQLNGAYPSNPTFSFADCAIENTDKMTVMTNTTSPNNPYQEIESLGLVGCEPLTGLYEMNPHQTAAPMSSFQWLPADQKTVESFYKKYIEKIAAYNQTKGKYDQSFLIGEQILWLSLAGISLGSITGDRFGKPIDQYLNRLLKEASKRFQDVRVNASIGLKPSLTDLKKIVVPASMYGLVAAGLVTAVAIPIGGFISQTNRTPYLIDNIKSFQVVDLDLCGVHSNDVEGVYNRIKEIIASSFRETLKDRAVSHPSAP